jgi:hypothetical protein
MHQDREKMMQMNVKRGILTSYHNSKLISTKASGEALLALTALHFPLSQSSALSDMPSSDRRHESPVTIQKGYAVAKEEPDLLE